MDGVDDFIALGAQPKVSRALTISAWVKIDGDNFDNFHSIFNNNQFGLMKNGRSEDNEFILFVNGVAEPNSITAQLPEGWIHVAGTWDGTIAQLYMNGVRKSSVEAQGQLTSIVVPARIGRGEPQGTDLAPFSGLIDEVAIFNYALSPVQVQAIYDGGDPAYLISLLLGQDGVHHEISLDAGESMQIVADIQDPDGNRVGGSLVARQLAPDVGAIDENGIFTAGTAAGTFPSAIEVNVVHEGERTSAVVDVIVEPGPFAKVEIEPSEVVVQQGDTESLTARAVDEYGNPIPGLVFLWEAERGLVVDQNGTVTASDLGGRYEVSARASYKGGQQTALATVGVPPVWIPVGNMLEARAGHTATLLPDDKVLVVGGAFSGELYDPITRTFSLTGSPVCNHGPALKATLLAAGRALLTGGLSDERCAEVYDPETGGFSKVGDLNVDHWEHTATLLADGRVLIAGGSKRQNDARVSHAVAEIYDPVTETFSVAGSLNLDRTGHTATLLPSGQVLITGGEAISTGSRACRSFAELYDPAANTSSTIAGPPATNCGQRATLLNNGNVLSTSHDGVAFLFDPVTGSFRTGGIMTGRGEDAATLLGEQAATLLPSGEVLITGGWARGTLPAAEGVENIMALATAEIYDPAAETFAPIETMIQARGTHTATLLSNGHVLVVGGTFALTTSSGEIVGHKTLRSAEIWIPANSQ